MSVAAIAGVVGAGAAVYGATQMGGDSGGMPPQTNPGKSLLQYLNGLDRGLPRLAEMEGTYRPQFGNLNIADQQQYLNALLGMSGTATTAAGQQLQTAKEADLANMQSNIPSILGILGSADPSGRQMAQASTQAAVDAQNRARSLTPQEARIADQTARESFAARGRINDNSSIAAELLQRDDVMAKKRAEATEATNNAFALNQQFTSPLYSLLGGVPASTSLGLDLLGSSQGIIGQNVPQFINPDAGINLGLANANNLAAYQQAQAARQSAQAGAYGSLGGDLLGLAGTLYKNRPQQ